VTLPPDPALPVDAAGQPASVLLAGSAGGAKADDRLLLVRRDWAGTDDTEWALVTVDSVSPEADPAAGGTNTRVLLSGGWGPQPTAPAPAPARTATDFRLLRPTAAASLWSQPSPAGANVIAADPTAGEVTVHLSAAVRALQPGDLVLFDGGPRLAAALAVVRRSTEVLWSVPFPPGSPQATATPPGTIVVAHTQLTLTTTDGTTLTGYLGGPDRSPPDLDAVCVRYGFRDVGAVVPAPRTQVASLPVTVAVPVGGPVPGGTVALLEDAPGAGVAVLPTGAGVGLLTLSGPPEQPAVDLDPPLAVPLRLIVNVLAVSRGVTVPAETLGSGNAAVPNQTFTLAKSPLTYLASGAGRVSTLRVLVDGVAWTEVATFYDQPPQARVYRVTHAPDQSTRVRFGDGVNGARLPTGSGNVTARYRYGSGAAGPPAGRLTSILHSQPNLSAIHNPVAVAGGKDPQPPGEVKTDAPASVFTFGRAISAVDYQVVAGQAPGVSRVRAHWTFDAAAQRTLVKVYVNDDPGVVAAARAALAGAEDPYRPVTVAGARGIPLAVSGTLVVAADREPEQVAAAAVAALSGLFSPAVIGIGDALYRSRVDAALSVPGVLGVHGLTVRWGQTLLDQVFDPGEGGYFLLDPAGPAMAGVSVDG
jgi:hypothetical protein